MAAALLAACSLSASGPLAAQERVTRRFDTRHGLDAATVHSLAQDSAGFVWVGTVGGLYRYDGVEIRRWAPERIQGRLERLVADASGRLLALEERGALWRVDGRAAAPVRGPGGEPLADVVDVAAGAGGALWVLRGDARMDVRGPDGTWRTMQLAEELGGEGPRHVFPRGRASVDLATGGTLWNVSREGDVRRVAGLPRVVDVLSLPDGRRVVVTFWRDAYVLDGGAPTKVADPRARGIDAVRRGGVVWIAYDRYLVRLGPGGGTDVLGPGDGLEAGAGPLLVDHEGSLWMGTFTGLVQFPEPETVTWADRDGLPSAHTRFVERAGDTVWVGTWQGTGRLVLEGSGWRADSARGWISRADVVADAEGDVWVGSTKGLLELRAGRDPVVHARDFRAVRAAARGEGETLWLGGYGGLFRVRTAGLEGNGGAEPRRVPGLDVPEDVLVPAVLLDDAGRLWVGVEERICRAPADAARTGGDPGWDCWAVPGAVHFSAFLQTSGGEIWAASPYEGVLRFRDGRWERLPGASDLATRSVLNLVPSPSGGVWVVGHGILRRVLPDADAPDGWRVVERLSAWHGLPAAGGGDVHEDPDGTLWIATPRGLARVPPSVRDRSPGPPGVALVEARVDDDRLDPAEAVELPHERNRLELRFAAVSYRAPSRVRYQVRLVPGSGWSDARGQPVVRWVDLDAGSYRAEIRASLDGESWTAEPAAFAFDVLPPWYREPRWIAAFAAAGVVLLLLLYRARVAHLLGLERQRTRIAMDLHDEMGAALGSIGIQAGMLARRGIDESRRLGLAAEIADTAETLGATLADMIWSLDSRAATLCDVAFRLEERGRRLFAGGTAEFTVAWPDRWPPDDLPATVRRNVLLVGLEALQNAARHAGADRVELSLAPARRGTWRLTVRDDGDGMSADGAAGGGRRADRPGAAPDGAGGAGRPAPVAASDGGLPPTWSRTADDGEGDGLAAEDRRSAVALAGGARDGPGEGNGLGLASMRQRAEELDGEIVWRRSGAGGTEMALVFPLRGRMSAGDRLRRWWSGVVSRLT